MIGSRPRSAMPQPHRRSRRRPRSTRLPPSTTIRRSLRPSMRPPWRRTPPSAVSAGSSASSAGSALVRAEICGSERSLGSATVSLRRGASGSRSTPERRRRHPPAASGGRSASDRARYHRSRRGPVDRPLRLGTRGPGTRPVSLGRRDARHLLDLRSGGRLSGARLGDPRGPRGPQAGERRLLAPPGGTGEGVRDSLGPADLGVGVRRTSGSPGSPSSQSRPTRNLGAWHCGAATWKRASSGRTWRSATDASTASSSRCSLQTSPHIARDS